jgi:hypothetical protein
MKIENVLESWDKRMCICGHSKLHHADEHDEVPTGTGRCEFCRCFGFQEMEEDRCREHEQNIAAAASVEAQLEDEERRLSLSRQLFGRPTLTLQDVEPLIKHPRDSIEFVEEKICFANLILMASGHGFDRLEEMLRDLKTL